MLPLGRSCQNYVVGHPPGDAENCLLWGNHTSGEQQGRTSSAPCARKTAGETRGCEVGVPRHGREETGLIPSSDVHTLVAVASVHVLPLTFPPIS